MAKRHTADFATVYAAQILVDEYERGRAQAPAVRRGGRAEPTDDAHRVPRDTAAQGAAPVVAAAARERRPPVSSTRKGAPAVSGSPRRASAQRKDA